MYTYRLSLDLIFLCVLWTCTIWTTRTFPPSARPFCEFWHRSTLDTHSVFCLQLFRKRTSKGPRVNRSPPPPFYVLIAFNVHHQWEKGNPTRNPSFYLRFGCSSLTIVPWKFMGNNNKAIRNQIVAWTFFCLICATLCGRGACTYLWPVAQQHWSSRVFTMKTVDRRSKVLSVLCNIVGHTLISRGTTIPAHFFSISHA